MTPHRAPRRFPPASLAVHWWEAVSGGRFFTVWTLLASGIVSVLILSPYTGLAGIGEHLAAMLASLLAWGVIVVLALPLAVAERHLTTRGARGALVIIALTAASVGRPFLNDAVASAMFGHDITGAWLQRIATNGFSWFTLLPVVAAVAGWYADSRDAAGRLTAAVDVFDDLRRRLDLYAGANAAVLADTIARLRIRRDLLLDDRIDFDSVRTFADNVRSASHGLDERLQKRVDTVKVREAEAPPAEPVPLLARFARPSASLVALLYFVTSAPYTFVVGGWPLVLAAGAVLVAIAVAADTVVRVWGRHRSPEFRGVLVLLAWLGGGVAMMTAGALLTSIEGIVLVVPLVTIPGLAAVVALATDALARARTHSRILTGLLADTAALATAQTARAREPLWRAVDLLHDRVQSRCVIFAARVDERAPTPEEIARFRCETDAAFDEILDGSATGPESGFESGDDLDGLLAWWAGVLEVRAEIDGAAVAALQSPAVAAEVVAAVGEGFVNAVKHSAARTARLTVTTAPDESAVTVAIASRGTLRAGPLGLGLASFGDRATLQQEGDEVVLEVVVPLGQGRVEGSAHRRRPPTMSVRLP